MYFLFEYSINKYGHGELPHDNNYAAYIVPGTFYRATSPRDMTDMLRLTNSSKESRIEKCSEKSDK